MNLYSNLRKNPFIRILFPYVIGILVAKAYSHQVFNFNFLVLISCFLLLGVSFYTLFLKLELKLTDFLIPAIVFSASIALSFFNIHDFEKQSDKKYVVGRVLAPPIEKTSSYQVKIKQLYPVVMKISQPCIHLYTDKDSSLESTIHPGDVICFKANLEPLKNRGNPNEFDYALYQATKGYYYQCYVPFSSISKEQKNDISSQFVSFLNYFRSVAKDIIHENFKSETARGILSALILGDKTELDDNIKSKFTDAGVIHVLAISGLHIGILYMFLSFILKPLQYRRDLRIVRIIVIICFIWFYASLTGFSSSVTRAALMFSLISIGNGLKREVSIYNILAASAFILLVINPLQLFDVGFQLSYVAVVGIIYIYPFLYSIFSFKNRLLDYSYQLICVSFAAQLATMPLTIFYFNQFPTYFWLANLVVIPAVFLLLFLGIFLLISAKIGFLAKSLSFIIGLIIDYMQKWVEFITTIPYSTLNGLHVHFAQVLLLFIVIYFAFSWIKSKKALHLLTVLSSIFIFLMISVIMEIRTKEVQQLVFYNTYKACNIGYYNKDENVLFSDMPQKDQGKLIENYFERHWLLNHKNRNIEYRCILDSFQNSNKIAAHMIHVKDTVRVLYVNSGFESIPGGTASTSHYIIISKEIYPPSNLKLQGTIIISAGLNKYFAGRWEEFAIKNKLDFHYLQKEGAYIVNL